MPKAPTSTPTGGTPTKDLDLITIHINRRSLASLRAKWSARLVRVWRTFLALLFFVSAVLGVLAYFK
jgi:hypothetical protein